LPGLRHAILNRPLEEALRIVAEGLALALAPAAARLWIADLALWAGGATRTGGLELLPALRLRAQGLSAGSRGSASISSATPTSYEGNEFPTNESVVVDPLITEVAAARRPTVLFDAVGHPLASAWTSHAEVALPTLGTLAAYPLRARGQFLGVLAVGSA